MRQYKTTKDDYTPQSFESLITYLFSEINFLFSGRTKLKKEKKNKKFLLSTSTRIITENNLIPLDKEMMRYIFFLSFDIQYTYLRNITVKENKSTI